jgi:hypothetical protein
LADESPKSASDLDKARARMERAIDRLESALSAGADENKNAADRIAADLAGAREEITRLRSANQTVSQRLDATIDRIRTILGD